MSNESSAYITIPSLNLTYHFTGVTSIAHHLSLKIQEKTDTTEENTLVNGAKNEPDRVTLSVVETDAVHSAAGWARRMLDVLSSVKRQRLLCRVVTPHHTYDNMLLSSVTATQDETSPDGWSGELTFTECLSVNARSEVKTTDNASTAKNVGSAAPPKAASGVVTALWMQWRRRRRKQPDPCSPRCFLSPPAAPWRRSWPGAVSIRAR